MKGPATTIALIFAGTPPNRGPKVDTNQFYSPIPVSAAARSHQYDLFILLDSK